MYTVYFILYMHIGGGTETKDVAKKRIIPTEEEKRKKAFIISTDFK